MLKIESDISYMYLKLIIKPWISHFRLSYLYIAQYYMYSPNLIHIYFKIVVHEGDSINIYTNFIIN